MNPMKILGIVLVAGGILALVYGGFSYTKETHEAKIGPLVLSVGQERQCVIWAGVSNGGQWSSATRVEHQRCRRLTLLTESMPPVLSPGYHPDKFRLLNYIVAIYLIVIGLPGVRCHTSAGDDIRGCEGAMACTGPFSAARLRDPRLFLWPRPRRRHLAVARGRHAFLTGRFARRRLRPARRCGPWPPARGRGSRRWPHRGRGVAAGRCCRRRGRRCGGGGAAGWPRCSHRLSRCSCASAGDCAGASRCAGTRAPRRRALAAPWLARVPAAVLPLVHVVPLHRQPAFPRCSGGCAAVVRMAVSAGCPRCLLVAPGVSALPGGCAVAPVGPVAAAALPVLQPTVARMRVLAVRVVPAAGIARCGIACGAALAALVMARYSAGAPEACSSRTRAADVSSVVAPLLRTTDRGASTRSRASILRAASSSGRPASPSLPLRQPAPQAAVRDDRPVERGEGLSLWAAAPRTLRSVGATDGTNATGWLATTSRDTRTAALDTGCACTNAVVGTATMAPGTCWLA